MANGYGYQPEGIVTAQPGADLGIPNVRSDVAGAGAGMDRVAQAGRDLMRDATLRQMQEDRLAVMERKSADTAAVNQALLEFQSRVTGDMEADKAAWNEVSSKIGQAGLASFEGSRDRTDAYRMEFDRLHSASLQKVQELSDKALRLRTRTSEASLLTSATKAAQDVVYRGGPDYVAETEKQFQAFSDFLASTPVYDQAEKDAKLLAARQHFYLEVAKYQAEARPGAFSRDWRDGVWAKHLSPEAVVQLQPFAQGAEITNAVRALQIKHKGNNAAAVNEALSDGYGTANGYTEDQQRKIAGYFEGMENFRWQQVQRGKELAAEAGIAQMAKLVAANDMEGIGRLANAPGVQPSVRLKAAEIFRNGMSNWRGDDATYKQALSGALTGGITAQGVLDMAGPSGLSMEQAVHVVSLINKTPQEDKENYSLALKAFSANNGDKEQQAQFMAALKYQAEKENAHGEAILYLGEKLGKDTGWIPFKNQAPYAKLYEDMQDSGATRARSQAQPSEAMRLRNAARELIKGKGGNPSEANIQAVLNDPEFQAMMGAKNGKP